MKNNKNPLLYEPEHYRERLSAYAAHTINIATPVGTFTQRANKEAHITVVDEGDGWFRVYLAYHPKIRLSTTRNRFPYEPVNDYFAKIRIDHEVRIEILPVQHIDIPLSTYCLAPIPATSILALRH